MPTAVYGVVLLLSGVAFTILVRVIIASQGAAFAAEGRGRPDHKGRLSVLMYAIAIPLAFVDPRISAAIYFAVALMWLIPDRRIEKHLHQSGQPHEPV